VIGKGVNHVVGTGCKPCVRYGPFHFWWAHQDLNLGPKDYESRHPKKTIRISRGYSASLSVFEYLCDYINKITRNTISLFGFEKQSIFGAMTKTPRCSKVLFRNQALLKVTLLNLWQVLMAARPKAVAIFIKESISGYFILRTRFTY